MSQGNFTSIDYLITINTKETSKRILTLELEIIRVMGYVRRFGGNESLNKLITVMQRTITTLHTLEMAIKAVQIARMAAGDPTAWLSAGFQVAAAGISTYSMYESFTGV